MAPPDGIFAGTTAELIVDAQGATSLFRIGMVPELNDVAATLVRPGFVRSRIGRSLNDSGSKDLARLAALLNED